MSALLLLTNALQASAEVLVPCAAAPPGADPARGGLVRWTRRTRTR